MLKSFFTAISFLFLFFIIVVTSTAYGQSVVWDENTKSWVSTATAPTPQPQQQVQTTQPQTPAPTVIQTVPTTAPNSAVDLGTLATVVTPIIGAIAGIFIKNKKDMEKKDEQVKQTTIDMIQQAVMPTLKQITPVAEQTAKQDIKLKEFGELIYKIMGEEANKISGMPEIQQQKLLEDAVRSKILAEQTYKQNNNNTSSTPSMVWDDIKKEWVSK